MSLPYQQIGELCGITANIILLPESWSPGLNANSQIIRAGFWGKGNKVYYSSDEEEDWECQSLKAVIPLLRQNAPFLFFKGTLGTQFWICDKICHTIGAGLGSLGLLVLHLWNFIFMKYNFLSLIIPFILKSVLYDIDTLTFLCFH
jgi:hypothetical protein